MLVRERDHLLPRQHLLLLGVAQSTHRGLGTLGMMQLLNCHRVVLLLRGLLMARIVFGLLHWQNDVVAGISVVVVIYFES